MGRVATNIPQEPLQWSVLRAAEEFGLDQVTLRKRLVKGKVVPDIESGCYSTSQIISAVFDDSKALRDREVKEKADNWSIRNQILRGELLSRQGVELALEASYQAVVQIIKGSNLTKKEQKDIMSNLEDCHKRLDNVARQQSSQIRKEESE